MRLNLRRQGAAPAGETAGPELLMGDDQVVAGWLESRAAALFSPDESALARMGSAVRAAFVASITAGAARPGFELGVGTFAEGELDGVDEKRFARAGFAGQHRISRAEAQLGTFDNGQVLDRELNDHGDALL